MQPSSTSAVPVGIRVEALERENAQLREALSSRVVIEQAKGVLSERYRLDTARAFELLQRAARSERRRIHELAAQVVDTRQSPPRIDALAAAFGALDDPAATTAKAVPDA
jgi:AmiR/NasT family two-component response regulator